MPRKRPHPPEPPIELPVLPVRDTVLFPDMIAPLYVGRERSIRALDEAMTKSRAIVLVAQKDPTKEDITTRDLYSIGSEAVVTRMLKIPDGTISVLIQGRRRLRIQSFVQQEPFFKASVIPITESATKTLSTEALMRAILALFEKCIKMSRSLTEETYVTAMNVEEPGALADFIASSLDLSVPQRQEILETINPRERLRKINILLAKELDVLELQTKIHSQVKQEVDDSQREFFLREQMKAIEKELGDSGLQSKDIQDLTEKIAAANMPEAASKKAHEELQRLAMMPPAAPEVAIIRTYLEWLIKLPWATRTEDNLDIKWAARILNENHYGLPRVKERILEYMAVRQLAAEKLKSPLLCFVGPPGVGKTSLGKSIAQALGRKFVRVSLGGIRDEAEIRGHRRTYIGALPGRIIQTMRSAGTVNPVFMLDEIDKLGTDFRGDPSSALLEVLDSEQNHAFSDHYLEVAYNLSRVLFIATGNILDPVPAALRDRMEVIEIPGYTEDEKFHIAKQFLVPKQIRDHGITPGQLRFSSGALRDLIRHYTREAGVRNLEREIASICRKVARMVAGGEKTLPLITPQSLDKFLGPYKYHWGTSEESNEIGVATGVVWSEAGGDLISVEVSLAEGAGRLTLTGQLGEVMQESARAALSYARSRAHQLSIKPRLFDKTDIHIHVPAGAIPKDGPSAGITIATALISSLTTKPVNKDVAMTGEITLRGRVLPVGGLKEKVLAAHRAGIKTFLLPKRNEKDLTEIPANVRRQVRFLFVEQMDEVLDAAFNPGNGQA
ncbi:MAG: endopeptidase La [Chloroflexi bacterium]|nr:endopeptidase La [Chloroflexota bacterium]